MPVRRAARIVDAWLDRVVVGRWWALRATAIAMATGMVLAGPPFGGFAQDWFPVWRYDLANSGPQLFDAGVNVDDQTGNLTFRVLPRLIGAILHLDQLWQFYVLQILFGALFLWMAATVYREAVGSRSLATLLTVATACTWAGATAWVETRGLFDAFGLAFLAVTLRVRHPAAVLAAALAASFCDERTIIVLPLVAAWQAWRPAVGDGEVLAAWRRLPVLALGAAALAHLAIRTWLKHRYGLPEGHNRYPENPLTQLRNYPNGLWGAYEGLWLLVAAGLATWWHRGQRWVVGAIVAFGSLPLIAGVSVVDISRAIAFGWPLVPVCLLGVRHLHHQVVRRLVWLATAVSMAWPMVYAAGDQSVDWAYPLPLVLLNLLRQAAV